MSAARQEPSLGDSVEISTARLAQLFWGQMKSDSNWAGAADLREANELNLTKFSLGRFFFLYFTSLGIADADC